MQNLCKYHINLHINTNFNTNRVHRTKLGKTYLINKEHIDKRFRKTYQEIMEENKPEINI